MSKFGLKKHPFIFYFLKNKRRVSVAIAALLFTNILDSLPPIFIGLAIDQIAEGAELNETLRTIAIIFGITLGLTFFRYAWRIAWGGFHHGVAEDLRNRVFHRFLNLSQSFFQKNPVGDLMSLINNDVNSFRMAIGPGVLLLFDAFFLLLIVPPLMWQISPTWTWQTMILLPFIPVFIAKVEKLIHVNYRKQQDRFGEMSGVAQEIIAGIRVIKSYAQENHRTELFNKYSGRYEKACNDTARVDAYFPPIMELGVTSGAVILLIVGAPEVMTGAVSIGSFFAFYQYIQRMIWPATALGISITFFQQGKASFARILKLLDEPIAVPDHGQEEFQTIETLNVNGLSFTYPESETPVLKNINFSLNQGEVLGVVGPTGSGKSTLVELICRVYEVDSQQIQINGKDLSEYKFSELRQKISLVPQEAFLFSQKISSNIALGGNSTHGKIEEMAKLVNIKKEVEELPEAYDSYLGERGVNLSGGQKQRLTIARALIRNSPLVILDDSLSAVDANTEKSILSSLQEHLTGENKSMAIVVSHRMASLRFATKILVLNNGEVEAIGTHSELMKSSPTYRTSYELQEKGGGTTQ